MIPRRLRHRVAAVTAPGSSTDAPLPAVEVMPRADDREENLRNEARLIEQGRLLDLANDAIIVRDAQDRITYWNQGAEVEYGYSPDEALGRNCHELLSTKFPLPLASINQILDRTRGWGGEVVQSRKDGTTIISLTRWVLDRDAKGRRRTVLETNTNITERKRSEEALHRGEARLRAVLETAVDAIITLDERGRMQSVNPASERMFGYSAAEMIGHNVSMLILAAGSEGHDWYLTHLRAGEKHIIDSPREVQARRKDGTVFPIDVVVSEVEPGKLFTGIIRDISERKQHEQALRQSEARFRQMADQAPVMVWTTGTDKMCTWLNKPWLDFVGRTLGQDLGYGWTDCIHPDDVNECMRTYTAAFDCRRPFRMEYRLRRHDGEYRWVLDSGTPLVGPEGEFGGFIGSCIDISERKQGEARLREADRMASIGSLAAGLGHDMNNVLLPVRAHLNALKAKDEAPPNRMEHLKKIQAGVSYLQQLADGLHFLAMDPDQVEDVSGATDLHVWWGQTGALLSKAVPKHVRVTTSLGPGLPAIAVAAHALTQAVLNLIVNGGEAIPPPSQRKRRQGYVRLSAELGADGSSVRLAVTDNGSGMAEEVKRRAFDMFFTTKPRGLGTGLGLAMVRKIVDRSGGTIEVESAPGKGTTIAMIFPTADCRNDRGNEVIAAVRIRDGRAASLVRSLLEVSGAQATHGDDFQRADIFLVEPLSTNIGDAKGWFASRPHGRLVLLGRPDPADAAKWSALQPMTIEEPGDLEQVRNAIGIAMLERIRERTRAQNI